MEWTEQMIDGILVVSLGGEIDLQHSPRLRQLLQVNIYAKTAMLVLDFQAVKYIDSSGLATLVEYYQQSRGFAGQIGLASLTPRVKSIFELVRLNEIFPIYSTVTEAREQMRTAHER